MPTNLDEIDAQIRETRALMASVGPDERRQLEQAVASLEQAKAMLIGVQPAVDDLRRDRPPLSPEVAAFFRPDPPAEIPTWVPHTIRQHEVSDELMRCPPGAKIYRLDHNVSLRHPARRRLSDRARARPRLPPRRLRQGPELLRRQIAERR